MKHPVPDEKDGGRDLAHRLLRHLGVFDKRDAARGYASVGRVQHQRFFGEEHRAHHAYVEVRAGGLGGVSARWRFATNGLSDTK